MQTAQLKIIAAVGIGIFIVTLAYFADSPGNSTTTAEELVASAPAPARTFIPTTDTDEDGIPDWQRSLVRTIPLEVPEQSTAEFTPDTLTEAFGVAFFEQYLMNQSYGTLGIDDEELVNRSASALTQNLQDTLIGPSALTITNDTSSEAIKAYGNSFASIVYKYPSERESELIIFERAIKANNPQELEKLRPILNDYRGMIVDMKLLTVPPSYIKEHLDILNSMQAIAFDIEAMLLVFDDPILTLIRIKRYENDVFGAAQAITNLYTKMVQVDQIRYTQNDPFGQLMGVTS